MCTETNGKTYGNLAHFSIHEKSISPRKRASSTADQRNVYKYQRLELYKLNETNQRRPFAQVEPLQCRAVIFPLCSESRHFQRALERHPCKPTNYRGRFFGKSQKVFKNIKWSRTRRGRASDERDRCR